MKTYSFDWYVDGEYMPFNEREKSEINALKKFLRVNRGKWVCVYEGDDWDAFEYWQDISYELYTKQQGVFADRYQRKTENSSSILEPKRRIMMKHR